MDKFYSFCDRCQQCFPKPIHAPNLARHQAGNACRTRWTQLTKGNVCIRQMACADASHPFSLRKTIDRAYSHMIRATGCEPTTLVPLRDNNNTSFTVTQPLSAVQRSSLLRASLSGSNMCELPLELRHLCVSKLSSVDGQWKHV